MPCSEQVRLDQVVNSFVQPSFKNLRKMEIPQPFWETWPSDWPPSWSEKVSGFIELEFPAF